LHCRSLVAHCLWRRNREYSRDRCRPQKQEIEQGQKTLEQFQKNLDQANQHAQQRVDQAVDSGR